MKKHYSVEWNFADLKRSSKYLISIVYIIRHSLNILVVKKTYIWSFIIFFYMKNRVRKNYHITIGKNAANDSKNE